MNYSVNLIQSGIKAVVPFGDQIPNISQNNSSSTQVSKRHERARIHASHEMKKAIKEGKLNPSYKTSVDKMDKQARTRLAEASYQKNQYLPDQIKKLGPVLNAAVPGSSLVTTAFYYMHTAKNLYKHAEQIPNTKNTWIKTAKIVVPALVAYSAPSLLAVVKPLIF